MSAHKNFTEAQELEVYIVETRESGTNVCMTQSAGSMYFQFGMTAEQARALAADLISHAGKADRLIAARAAA